MEGYTVYILVSIRKSNWSYVGMTEDLSVRFHDHQAGKTKSTKAYRPLKIIHTESYPSLEEARARELYLKSGFGREEKKTIISTYLSDGISGSGIV